MLSGSGNVEQSDQVTMPAEVPHYHVDEQTQYVKYLGSESGDEVDSTPAYTGEQAASYIMRRVPPVGADLEMGVDRFELDEETDERTFEMATWTIRICFLGNCETQEDFGTFIELMAEVEGEDDPDEQDEQDSQSVPDS